MCTLLATSMNIVLMCWYFLLTNRIYYRLRLCFILVSRKYMVMMYHFVNNGIYTLRMLPQLWFISWDVDIMHVYAVYASYNLKTSFSCSCPRIWELYRSDSFSNIMMWCGVGTLVLPIFSGLLYLTAKFFFPPLFSLPGLSQDWGAK